MNSKDYERGRKINEKTELKDGENPIADAIEKGSRFEGDMDLTKEEEEAIKNENREDSIAMRSVMMHYRWPRNGDNVYIPYHISGTYYDFERANIARAFEDYENNTCIR